jgi:hypothetical protein
MDSTANNKSIIICVYGNGAICCRNEAAVFLRICSNLYPLCPECAEKFGPVPNDQFTSLDDGYHEWVIQQTLTE